MTAPTTDALTTDHGSGSAARRALGLARRVPVLLLVAVIQVYRTLISPMTGPSCRYYPSCSQYALTAVQRHGALRGSWLAVRRLGRCHPWAAGGVDDVPPAGSRASTHDHGRSGHTSRSSA